MDGGAFPTIISIITMFFVAGIAGFLQSAAAAAVLTGVILFSILMSLLMSNLLSSTILKGVPSSYTLELPAYRVPQFGKVIVRSIFDRTLFVLGRAVVVALPAGLIIWICANVKIDGLSLLSYAANFLDPFAQLMGLDGIILIAFILGFPANEIVIPIIIMAYMATGTLVDADNLIQLKTLLVDNGWTWLTALNVILFSLNHFPCSTTCMTIKKETGSIKWTLISFILPTVAGILLCMLTTLLATIFGLV